MVDYSKWDKFEDSDEEVHPNLDITKGQLEAYKAMLEGKPAKVEKINDKFSKTIVNHSEKRLEESDAEYVAKMEDLVYQLVYTEDIEKVGEFLKHHMEIVSEETHTYLLLHLNDMVKEGKDEVGFLVAKSALIIKYCLEMGSMIEKFFSQLTSSKEKKLAFEQAAREYYQAVKESVAKSKNMDLE